MKMLLVSLVLALLYRFSNGSVWERGPAISPGVRLETISSPSQCSRQASTSDMVSLHYWVRDRTAKGKMLYWSEYEDQRLEFQLGDKRFVMTKALHVVVNRMCVGERRRAIIPYEFLGDRFKAMTQPGKDLYFELELVSISDGPKIDTMAKMDSNEDGKVDKKEYSSYEKQIKAHIYDHLIKTNKMNSAQILEEEIASEVFYAFKEHDKNGDGFLSKREFRYWHDEL